MGRIIVPGEVQEEGVALEALETDVPSLHVRKFSNAARLADLAEEYVFFTHGLLFTHAFWLRDPIVDHIVEQKGEADPFHIQLPMPIFRWFDAKDPSGNVVDDSWNYQICAIPKEQWDPLFAFLSTISGSNRQTKMFHLTAVQKVPIADALAIQRMTVAPKELPTVDCYCLAILGNRRSVYFAPQHAKDARVPIVIGSSDPQAARFCRNLFAGSYKPAAGAIEPTVKQSEDLVKNGPDNSATIMRSVSNPAQTSLKDKDLLGSFEGDQVALDLVNGAVQLAKDRGQE